MRCIVCDKRLNDYETTLKHAETGQYLDTCIDCLSDVAKYVPMPVKGRRDLLVKVDTEDIDVDELSQDEYNRYSKDNSDDKDY